MSLFGIAAVVAVVFAFLWWSDRPSAKSGKLKVKAGNFSVGMDIKNRELSLDLMLKTIFASPEGQIQARALMAKQYQLYGLDDPNLIIALESLSSKALLAEHLRDLAAKQRGPFKRELVRVVVSFPGSPDFKDTNCVVCSGSALQNQWLMLYDNTETNSVKLFAGNWRPCQSQEMEPAVGAERIQITMAAARKLFGDRALAKFEAGWVGPAE